MARAIPFFFVLIIVLAGATSSCKHPVDPNPLDTAKHDTTHHDTTHVDTTYHDTTHVDTTHKPPVTTSHDFIWREYTIPGENNMTGCWVFNAYDIIAVNNYLYRYNGAWERWPIKDEKGVELEGLSGFTIFGFSPSDFWLTDYSLLFHFDGTVAHSYRLENTGVWSYPEDGVIHAAWGTSSKDMYFVGDKGTILHFDGAKWMKYPRVTSKDLRSISGTSNRNIWCCGFSTSKAETVMLHFDGTAWNLDTLSDQVYTQAVWSCDSMGHSFTVASSAWLESKRDQQPWIRDYGIPNKFSDGSYNGVAPGGNATNDYFAVGSWGFVAHWNGTDWHQYSELYDYSDVGYGTLAFSVKGNTFAAVGVRKSSSWLLVGQR